MAWLGRCFYIAWENQIINTNLNEMTFDASGIKSTKPCTYGRALNIASENHILDYSFSVFSGDYLILKLMHNKFP